MRKHRNFILEGTSLCSFKDEGASLGVGTLLCAEYSEKSKYECVRLPVNMMVVGSIPILGHRTQERSVNNSGESAAYRNTRFSLPAFLFYTIGKLEN